MWVSAVSECSQARTGRVRAAGQGTDRAGPVRPGARHGRAGRRASQARHSQPGPMATGQSHEPRGRGQGKVDEDNATGHRARARAPGNICQMQRAQEQCALAKRPGASAPSPRGTEKGALAHAHTQRNRARPWHSSGGQARPRQARRQGAKGRDQGHARRRVRPAPRTDARNRRHVRKYAGEATVERRRPETRNRRRGAEREEARSFFLFYVFPSRPTPGCTAREW